MKILFVGDASNLNNTLAHALRDMGHTATVASSGSQWMNTGRDIDLRRRPSKWGAIAYGWQLLRALPLMRGYDVVELASPIFLELRPERLQRIFHFLKRHNGRVVLNALSTDWVYYHACHDGHTFRYSDYRLGDKPSPYVDSPEYHRQHQENWGKAFMRRYNEHVLQHVDGVIACLWEYYAAYLTTGHPHVAYAGIPIDTGALTFRPLEQAPATVKLFIGLQRDRMTVKGTDLLLEAARRVAAERPEECELVVVENKPYAEYTQLMRQSHVLLDQLYSYTPATNALIAMSQGLVAVSGAEPEYYALIGEGDNHPIVNVSPLLPRHIDEQLHRILDHKDALPALARASRDFVVKHNEMHLVARRHLDFFDSLP